MTTRDKLDLERMLGPSDRTMRRVIDDLDRACPTPMPAHARAAIAHTLEVAGREPAVRKRSPRLPALSGLPMHQRVASLLAVVAVVLAGVLGSMRLQGPTPVSAAQILRRGAAAAMQTAAGDVVHEVAQARLTTAFGDGPSDDFTSEMWTQLDTNGRPVRIDLVTRSPNPALDERTVADGQGNLWIYGASPDVVTKTAWSPGTPLVAPVPPSEPDAIRYLAKEVLDAPQDPRAMRDLLTVLANDGRSRLLGQETIDGRTVDVVQVSVSVAGGNAPHGWTSEVYAVSLDASTSLVRRIDVKGIDDSGEAMYHQTFDITTYEIVPLSDVPPGTFTFTPAPGTKVCTGQTAASCTIVGNRR